MELYGQDLQSPAPNKAESNPPATDTAVQNSANSNGANSDKAVSDGTPSHEGLDLSNEEILALLEEPFLCSFQRAAPINEVLSHITKTTGIAVFVNRSAWESAGITSSTPVQFRLPFQIPLRDALDYLVRQLDAAWFVKDGRIELTSKEDGNLPLIKVYDIGDLIGMESQAQNIKTTSNPASQSTENPESEAPSTADPQTVPIADWEAQSRGLENYLKTTVAPETWENDAYYIKPHPAAGTLTIMQSASVHVRIDNLLQRLQQFNNIQIVFDCKLLTEDGYEQYPPIKCRNGGEVSIKIERSKDVILRIVPIPPHAVSEDVIAPYKPLLVHIPRETKSIKVKGVVRKENIIRVAVTIEDRKPEACLFQAVPVYNEEGKEYTRPRKPDIVSINTQESPVTKTYVVSELIRSGMKENDLSDVIKANIPPAAWQGGNTLVFDENKNLIITQMPDVHRQIADLLTLIQERIKFQ